MSRLVCKWEYLLQFFLMLNPKDQGHDFNKHFSNCSSKSSKILIFKSLRGQIRLLDKGSTQLEISLLSNFLESLCCIGSQRQIIIVSLTYHLFA